jgi:aspartyl-tRNA(Asn)/glutamyl-tRNA(Gln) amidotransferase subunit A
MFHSLEETRNAIFSGSISIESLVKHYLKSIDDKKSLNAFVEVFEQEAITLAQEVDVKIKKGTAGKLAGLVIGIKDNICYKGHKVSAASNILNNYTSIYSATCVERLVAEDAIIIGRLNCDEFGMGSSNENSVFGPVKNPYNEKLVAGGSSGGSAAAVAAGLCMAALGSDTGGSIRQPASFCGIIGLKPTYGRVSRHGLLAYASSFDQIGIFSNTVEDCAAILSVISGEDAFDSTVSSLSVPDYSSKIENKSKKRIAYFREYIENEGLDYEIKEQFNEKIKELQANGHTVEAIDFPFVKYLIPCYYLLTTAEASSNLSRYDGVHYGHRSANATDLESTYILSRNEGFGAEVKRRILLGTFVLSAGYYDAYYSKAQKVRRMIRDFTLSIFEKFDFILLPTTPGTAFPIGEKSNDPLVMYLEDIFTVQANLCGIPAISLPLGKHSNGLPFGIQLMGNLMKENELLTFSEELLKRDEKIKV